MSKFIKWLDEITSKDRDVIGTKGANLGELLSKGIPVPDFYCITTEAYKCYVNNTGIRHKMIDIMSKTDFNNLKHVKANTAQIREQFLTAEIPDEILQEVEDAYQKLCDRLNVNNVSVSVRSSATMEDLSDASFAGLYDTYLNVSGLANINHKIKMCWASLWTENNLVYMANHRLNYLDGFMSVVIQQMINADVAGVLFTANPISGNPFEIVINSSWGLGESVASGIVTPDRFVINEENLELKEKQIAEKKTMIVPADDNRHGISETDVPVSKQKLQSLEDDKVAELCKLSILIMQFYGGPQDIEWAFKSGKFFILQVRPITSLPDYFPFTWENDEDKKRDWSLAYGHAPFSPFGRSFDYLKKDMYRNALVKITKKRFLFHHRIINGYIYVNKEWIYSPPPLRWLTIIWSKIYQFYMGRRIYREWQQRILRDYFGDMTDIFNSLNDNNSVEVLVDSVSQIVFLNVEFHKESVPYDFYCNFYPGLLVKLCEYFIPSQETDYTILFQGFENKSIEKDRILSELANMVRRDAKLLSIFSHNIIKDINARLRKSEEGKKFLIHMNNILKKDFSYLWARSNPKDPGCEEDPSVMIAIIKEYIQCPDDCNMELKYNQKIIEREKIAQSIKNKLSSSVIDRLFPVRQKIFSEILGLAQKYYPLKEDSNHYLYTGTWFIKKSLLFLGKRLVDLGKLLKAEDIFLFSFYEVQRIPEMIDGDNGHFFYSVNERRKEFEKQKRLIPPGIISFSHREYERKDSENKSSITGLAGSRGVVTGTARLIYSPEQFERLKKGEILVCPTTRPFWTPLFTIAGGLVTDHGGVLSHGANIAREYGIPAVIGTKSATRTISDGKQITVDGTKGKVYLVKK